MKKKRSPQLEGWGDLFLSEEVLLHAQRHQAFPLDIFYERWVGLYKERILQNSELFVLINRDILDTNSIKYIIY